MSVKLILSWAIAFVVGSLLFEWYSVAAVGGVCGWFLIGRKPIINTAVAASIGWWVLLIGTATRGEVGKFAATLGAVMGLAPVVLFLLVGIFPALLAGSAAALTSAVREWQEARRTEAV